MIFTEQAISLFVKEPELILASAKAFKVMIAVFPILSIYYVSIYYYQSIGKAKSSFVLSIFRQIIVLLPVSLILVKILDMGALGVWLSYPIADFTSGVLSIFLIRKVFNKLDYRIEEKELKDLEKKLFNGTL